MDITTIMNEKYKEWKRTGKSTINFSNTSTKRKPQFNDIYSFMNNLYKEFEATKQSKVFK